MDDKRLLVSQDIAAHKSWIRFEENRNREWGLYGIDTGIHDLNLAIGGIVPTDVTTIAGRSGHGKTALLVPIIMAADRYTDVKPEFIVFTWEMEASMLVDRLLSYETGLNSRDLMIGAKLLENTEIDRVKKALEKLKSLPVMYQQHSTDANEVSAIFQEFCEECERKEQEDGIKRQPVGVVDFIGLADLDGDGLRTYGINDFMLKIKQTANRTSGSFIILSQISKSADAKDKPDRGDIADSQSIENNSDNLIIINRPEYLGRMNIEDPKTKEHLDAKQKMLFRILKCRRFGPSEFVAGCHIAKYKFWSLSYDKDYPYWNLYKSEDFWRSHFGFDKKKASLLFETHTDD